MKLVDEVEASVLTVRAAVKLTHVHKLNKAIDEAADPLLQDIEQFSRLPGGTEFFKSMVEDAKAKLAEMLKTTKKMSKQS